VSKYCTNGPHSCIRLMFVNYNLRLTTRVFGHSAISSFLCGNVCDKSSHTVSTNVCDTVSTNVCETVSTNVCDTVSTNVCDTVSTNVCDTVSTNVCETYDFSILVRRRAVRPLCVSRFAFYVYNLRFTTRVFGHSAISSFCSVAQ